MPEIFVILVRFRESVCSDGRPLMPEISAIWLESRLSVRSKGRPSTLENWVILFEFRLRVRSEGRSSTAGSSVIRFPERLTVSILESPSRPEKPLMRLLDEFSKVSWERVPGEKGLRSGCS